MPDPPCAMTKLIDSVTETLCRTRAAQTLPCLLVSRKLCDRVLLPAYTLPVCNTHACTKQTYWYTACTCTTCTCMLCCRDNPRLGFNILTDNLATTTSKRKYWLCARTAQDFGAFTLRLRRISMFRRLTFLFAVGTFRRLRAAVLLALRSLGYHR